MLLLNLVVVTILLVSLVFLPRLLRELLLLSLTLQSIHKSNPFRKFFLWNISKMCKNKINGNRKIFSRSRKSIFGEMLVKNYSSIIKWVITSSIHTRLETQVESLNSRLWSPETVKPTDGRTESDGLLADRSSTCWKKYGPSSEYVWKVDVLSCSSSTIEKYHGSPGKFVHVHKLESCFTLDQFDWIRRLF